MHALDSYAREIPVDLRWDGGVRTPVRRALGSVQRSLLRMTGPRWCLLPRAIRRMVRAGSIERGDARRTIRSMDTFSDWTRAWVDAADRHHGMGDMRREVAALGIARLVLDVESPRNLAISRRLRELYLARTDVAPIEAVVIDCVGTAVPLLLQLPNDGPAPTGGWPLLIVQAGVGEAKERSHRLAHLALARGIACCRIDMPDHAPSEHPGLAGYLPGVIDALVRDRRLDSSSVHLFGNCFGAALVLAAASERDVASVTTIGAWYHFEPTSGMLPQSLLEYLCGGYDATRDESGAIVEMPGLMSLRGRGSDITCPVRLYHGALDPICSARESWKVADEVGATLATCTTFLLQGHGCIGKRRRIELELLEFIEAGAASPTTSTSTTGNEQRRAAAEAA